MTDGILQEKNKRVSGFCEEIRRRPRSPETTGVRCWADHSFCYCLLFSSDSVYNFQFFEFIWVDGSVLCLFCFPLFLDFF